MKEPRVSADKKAVQLTRQLAALYGPLAFQISNPDGCGFTVSCLPEDSEPAGSDNVLLGLVDGCRVYTNAATVTQYKNRHFVLGMEKGEAESGSLEGILKLRFTVLAEVTQHQECADMRMLSYLIGYSGKWG